jgi:peptidoglycan/LPS O-acetylase OafA/YrhL
LGLHFAEMLADETKAPRPPRWLVAWAGFSYSLYIVHFPLLLFARGGGVPIYLAAPAVLAIAMIAGRTVERWKPFQKARPAAAAASG